MPATKREPCGACSHLHVKCLPNCFWAQYIKPGEGEKFSLLVEDTSVDSFKARVIEWVQQFIDRQYEFKMEMKREHEKATAVVAADSDPSNPQKGKTVVDVAEAPSNHHEGKGGPSNVAEDSLNHHEGQAVIDLGPKWASKRARSCQPTGELLNHHEGQAVVDFGPKWGSKRARSQPTGQLLLLARCAEMFMVADMLFEMANDVD